MPIEKAAILVGGYGTRISSFSKQPKPLIKIKKNTEILKLIINIFFKNKIKKIYLLCRDNNQDKFQRFIKKNKLTNVKIINTGINSLTGKRISFLKKYINKNENFCLTYGDSLANFNLKKTFKSHKKYKNLITANIYKSKSKYGEAIINKNKVIKFEEKRENIFINAGFYILNEKILNKIIGNVSFESKIIPKICKQKKFGFVFTNKWHPLDTEFDFYSIKKWIEKNKNEIF